MMHLQFICPKCGRKTLIERFEGLVMHRRISHIDFYDTAHQSVSNSHPTVAYRVGEEDIQNYDEAVHVFLCKKCSFMLPIRNTAELIEWLLFHKMITLGPWESEKWPFSRAKLIKTGEISRKLLKELYGPAYVPPTEAELIAALQKPPTDG